MRSQAARLAVPILLLDLKRSCLPTVSSIPLSGRRLSRSTPPAPRTLPLDITHSRVTPLAVRIRPLETPHSRVTAPAIIILPLDIPHSSRTEAAVTILQLDPSRS